MKKKPTKERERPQSDEGGVALVWALLAIVGLSFMGIAANHIAQGSQFITENFEHEARAQYRAAGTLEQYRHCLLQPPKVRVWQCKPCAHPILVRDPTFDPLF